MTNRSNDPSGGHRGASTSGRRFGGQRASFDRGFVAAAIVVGAIALCGIALVASALLGPPAAATAPGGTPDSTGTPDPGGSVRPGDSVRPGGGQTAGSSVRPGGDATTSAGGSGPAACVVPAGAQEVPLRPPGRTDWDVWNRMVVPRSAEFGPGRVESDGFRRCFAHSPTGAVFAAYYSVAALADDDQVLRNAARVLLPGPDTDRMLADLAAEGPGDGVDDAPSQLAGFRVIDAGPDRVTVALAMRVKDAYASATFTMVWHRDDWRVLAARPGQQFGAPYSQLSGLGDFVRWSGL